LLIFFTSILGKAQIVNVEKSRKSGEKAFEGSVNFEFNVKDIGDDILELKSNADLQYVKGKSRFIFLNYVGYMKYNRNDIQNLGYQHIRYNYTFRDSGFVTAEFFVQHQYNEIKLFKKRIIEGIGPRFRIFNRQKLKWYAAPLIMNEYEQMLDSASTRVKTVRLDAYTSLYIDFNEIFGLKHITYFQPDITDFDDSRLSSETTLRLKITKKAAIDVGYSFDYDSQPPEGVQDYFYSFLTKFVLMF
jgi:putative salt-induced outer membrane protein YdiY